MALTPQPPPGLPLEGGGAERYFLLLEGEGPEKKSRGVGAGHARDNGVSEMPKARGHGPLLPQDGNFNVFN